MNEYRYIWELVHTSPTGERVVHSTRLEKRDADAQARRLNQITQSESWSVERVPETTIIIVANNQEVFQKEYARYAALAAGKRLIPYRERPENTVHMDKHGILRWHTGTPYRFSRGGRHISCWDIEEDEK